MKTPEEWFETFKELFLDGNNKFVNDCVEEIPMFIEKIQEDARKDFSST